MQWGTLELVALFLAMITFFVCVFVVLAVFAERPSGRASSVAERFESSRSVSFLNDSGKSLVDRTCIIKAEDDAEFRFTAYDMFERYPYGTSTTTDRCVLPGSGMGLVDRLTCEPIPDIPNPLKDNPIVRSVEPDPLSGTTCVVTFDASATRQQLQGLDRALLEAVIDGRTVKMAECKAELAQTEAEVRTCEKDVMTCSARLATCHENLQRDRGRGGGAGAAGGGAGGGEQKEASGAAGGGAGGDGETKFAAIKSTALFDSCLKAGSVNDAVSLDSCDGYGSFSSKLWSRPVDGKWGQIQSNGKCMRIDPASGAISVAACSAGDYRQAFVHSRGRFESKAAVGQCLQVVPEHASIALAECSDDQRQVFRMLGNSTDEMERQRSNKDILRGDHSLLPGQHLMSDNGQYRAEYTKDRGELVIYNRSDQPTWSTNTRLPPGRNPGHCKLHLSGILTLVDAAGTRYWENHVQRRHLAKARFPCVMQLGDDGVLRIADDGGSVIWKS